MQKKKKILICFGTRPEALKLTSLVLGLKKNKKLQPIVLLTAQHRKMVDQVVRLFRLPVNYDLNLMTPNQSLASLSERLIRRLDEILDRIKPDCMIVQGDTTTAFLAALTAFYHKIPIGHVEAGLRTDDKYQPFPEEINRRLITQVADFYFAPTALAAKRLRKEGIAPSQILTTGNTGIDALKLMEGILRRRKEPPFKLPKNKKMILVTAHRRESFGAPLKNICRAIRKIADIFPNVQILYPVHLNPNVKKVAYPYLKGHPRITLMEPVAYDALVYLMSKADLILTDSGGIQEEAPTFHKPTLILRNVTERPEGVWAGFNKIVGQDPKKIVREAKRYLTQPRLIAGLKKRTNPYGDGKAADRIIRFLEKKF
jgi:UDP-N-acetylglucosamine 2-epimerase